MVGSIRGGGVDVILQETFFTSFLLDNLAERREGEVGWVEVDERAAGDEGDLATRMRGRFKGGSKLISSSEGYRKENLPLLSALSQCITNQKYENLFQLVLAGLNTFEGLSLLM